MIKTEVSNFKSVSELSINRNTAGQYRHLKRGSLKVELLRKRIKFGEAELDFCSDQKRNLKFRKPDSLSNNAINLVNRLQYALRHA